MAAVRIPVPLTVPPVVVKEPMVSFPPIASSPLETATAAVSANRFAEARLRSPPETLTFAAADVPLSEVVPLEVFTVPSPNFTLTVPPFRA